MNRFLKIWFTILGACFVVASCEGVHAFADSRGTFLSAQSMGASFNGNAIRVGNLVTLNMQVIVSSCSSCNGTFKWQMSNALAPASGDWGDIANTSQIANADGSYVWEFKTPGFYWLRPVYTRTAGTGSATGYSSAKDNK